MRPALALVLLLSGCTIECGCPPRAAAPAAPAPPKAAEPPEEKKAATATLNKADNFMITHPRATNTQVIRALELSEHLRRDLRSARRHGDPSGAVNNDIEQLKKALAAPPPPPAELPIPGPQNGAKEGLD